MELVIVKPGASLHITGGRLRVCEPEAESDRYFALGELTQITLDRRCYLSSAVLYTALEHGIEVVLTGRGGYPVGRLWSQRFGSITTIRRQQLAWSQHRDASAWVVGVLLRKLGQQRAVLYSLHGRTPLPEAQLERADRQLHEVESRLAAAVGEAPAQLFDRWRSAEGQASRVYFQTLSAALPGEWAFAERSQHPARDAFNALLNYGYGVLYHRVEGAMLHAGLDPSIGVFHADGYRRPSLVYDLIEPFRGWVDFTAVGLVLAKALAPEDFAPAEDDREGVWLGDGARRILVQSLVDYYSVIIEWDGQRRTRLTHLQAECHALAQKLLKWQANSTFT